MPTGFHSYDLLFVCLFKERGGETPQQQSFSLNDSTSHVVLGLKPGSLARHVALSVELSTSSNQFRIFYFYFFFVVVVLNMHFKLSLNPGKILLKGKQKKFMARAMSWRDPQKN